MGAVFGPFRFLVYIANVIDGMDFATHLFAGSWMFVVFVNLSPKLTGNYRRTFANLNNGCTKGIMWKLM